MTRASARRSSLPAGSSATAPAHPAPANKTSHDATPNRDSSGHRFVLDLRIGDGSSARFRGLKKPLPDSRFSFIAEEEYSCSQAARFGQRFKTFILLDSIRGVCVLHSDARR